MPCLTQWLSSYQAESSLTSQQLGPKGYQAIIYQIINP